MNEASADRYGPYQIVAPLSAGGMGEVFRARDTRLQRDVALKILPKALASDADRRRRFFQEAQAAGALNHPNILSIHDVCLEGDTPYLVTELVEGSTLRDEIDRGAMAVSRVLELASQIAAGLQAAHAIGIVHRDLKPENVMVTRDGRAKILDFGLAKTLEPSTATDGVLTQTQTEVGLVLGTVPYMSPQQARGEAVDFRSDQFSFGLVLHEMLTGVHPFRRDTSVQTMSAIIADEAKPLVDDNRNVPVQLRWIIDRCLAKDPAARYASTADLARDLAILHARFGELTSAPIAHVTPRRRTTVPWSLALSGLILAVGLSLWTLTRPEAAALKGHRFSPLVTDAAFQSAPAWSPDGKSLAYVSQVDGVLQIFTRSVAASSLRAQLTRSLFDCVDPFWSPDGTRIYFHSQAEDSQGLWSVSAAGGEPELVLRDVARSAMSPDGRSIVFFRPVRSRGFINYLRLMSASPIDAAPQPIQLGEFAFDAGDGTLRFSPDGSKVLVWAYPGLYRATGPQRTNPFWLVDWPARTARPVFGPLAARTLSGAIAFSWMPDSRFVVVSLGEPGTAARHLWLADTEADQLRPITLTPATEGYPSVSPDGRGLAFTSEAVDFDLVTLPLDGGPPRPFLTTSRNEFDPSWSEVLSQLLFVTDRSGSLELWVRSADGQFERPLVTGDMFPIDQTWAIGATAVSPDGTRVAYQRLGERSGYRVWISTTAGAGPPVQFAAELTTTPGDSAADAPAWSPDGAWLAYRFQGEIYKRRVGGSGGGGVALTSKAVAFTEIDWSPDGRAIVFTSNDGLAIVPADGGALRMISEDSWLAYGWSSDSRTVLGVREGEKPRHLAFVAVDAATGEERVINPDLGVIPAANQPVRGLTRVGRHAVVTSIARARSDIWMVEGFRAAPSGFDLWSWLVRRRP